MKAKNLGIVLLLVAILGVGSAQTLSKGVGKPLPKPAPPTCDSDMLCW